MQKKKLFLVILLTSIFMVPVTASASGQWSPATSLTSNLTDDDQPTLSSSGNRIAFVSNLTTGPELFSISSDGTDLRQLTSNRARECCPSITRDGNTIVFQSDLRGDEEVFLISANGTIPQSCTRIVPGTGCQLTDNRDDDVTPVINAVGSKIAFASNRDGDLEIFAMNPDGSGVLQLTSNVAVDENPAISGDGSLVVFDSNLGGDFEIFIVQSDALGLRQLTSNFDLQDKFPEISEDGSKIAFESSGPAIAAASNPSAYGARLPNGPGFVETSMVMTINSDGTGLKPLTTNSADNRDASISGNGSLVAFVSNLDGDKEIFTVNSDGTMMTQVTMNTAIDISPRLSYAGDTLVFASNLDGDFEIFSASITTVDVAVTQIVTPRTIGYNLIASIPLEVRVTVANQGTSAETAVVEFSVQGGPVLSSQSVILDPGNSQVLTFWLNPQPMVAGTYTLTARAVPLAGETDTSDNTLNGGPVTVRRPGDVDGDRDVDILDAAILAFYYGTTCSGPVFHVEADLDNDCDVDILDAAALAFYYGTVG